MARNDSTAVATPLRPRNDVGQYVDLRDEWWRPRGAFAMLHWIAAARARLVPTATRPGSVLVDLGCGAGVLAPHVAHLGHRHIGVDLVPESAEMARERGVTVIVGDVHAIPLDDACADVVVAGEVLEHVPDLTRTVAESTRSPLRGGDGSRPSRSASGCLPGLPHDCTTPRCSSIGPSSSPRAPITASR